MNEEENPIAGKPSMPTRKKVSYGKLTPEARELLAKRASEEVDKLAPKKKKEKESKLTPLKIRYVVPGILTTMFWLFVFEATASMLLWYFRLSDSKMGEHWGAVIKQEFHVGGDAVWLIPASIWVTKVFLIRLGYEVVTAVFEILKRLRDQDSD